MAKNVQRGDSEPERVNVLGVEVSAINMAQALAIIGGWIAQRQQRDRGAVEEYVLEPFLRVRGVHRHIGAARHTELGLTVVKVDAERNLLFVRGAIPGARNGIVTVAKQGGPSRHD